MSLISLPATIDLANSARRECSRGERDPSLIPGLTADQQARLTQVLDEWMRRLEAGERPAADDLVAAHPDLAEHLRKYIGSLQWLQDAAGGFGGAIDLAGSTDGQRLGDFRLLREIGRGGMAIVYEAVQVSIGRLVALKVLPPAALLDGKQLARFRNEAQALGQLEHPHIVPIHAVGEDRGTHFFAMRLIEGIGFDRVIDTLSGECSAPEANSSAAQALSQLATRRPQWFRQAISLVLPIARALHAAHEYGVVHRDIKPSNLLIDRGGKPWVADFGLARAPSNTALTRTGDIIGTVRYMSPEQARGESALVDQRTDVYSLGLTLYELATLRRAFDDEDGPKLLARIREASPPRPSTFAPDLPPDLENVILKAIAPTRDARYATAQDFADDLERILLGERTFARAPTWSERFGKLVRRHRQAAISIASGLVLLTVSSLVAAGLIYREKVQKDAALAQSNRNVRKAREVVDRFGAQLAEQLATVPGAEDVRRSLLRGTIDYYRDFIEQSGGHDGPRAELATALNKIAVLTEHVGANDEALATHEEARAAFEQLAKDEPERVEHLANQALCENNLGLLLDRMGRPTEAERRFREAIQRQYAVIARRRGEPRFVRDLALTWNNLGLLLREQGHTADASQAFQAAVELHETLATNRAWSQSPEGALAGRYLAATHANIAALQADRDAAAALASSQRALTIQRSLAARFPQRTEFAADLALTCNHLGALQSRIDDHAAASASYAEAITALRRLVAVAPSSLPYRRDLALSLNNRGLALARDGQPNAAERSFRDAAETQQRLVDEHPDDPHDLGSLGGIWNNLGLMFATQNQPSRAVTAYEQALRIQRSARTAEPPSLRSREYLDRTLTNFSKLCREHGELDKSLDLTLQRRALWSDQPDRLWSVAVDLAELAKPDPGFREAPSMPRHELLKLTADTVNTSVRHGLDRHVATRSAPFQELIGDDQFRALLGWPDWRDFSTH